LLTREQQIKILIDMGTKTFQNRFKYGLVILAIGLTIGGAITLNPVFFMVAAFVGIVAFSACQTSPHIQNAVKGFAEGTRVQGEVSFSITRWSDTDTYFVTMISGCSRSWKFEFIPQGWIPVEQNSDAELVFLSGVEWPVLLLTNKGIMYPRYTPTIDRCGNTNNISFGVDSQRKTERLPPEEHSGRG